MSPNAAAPRGTIERTDSARPLAVTTLDADALRRHRWRNIGQGVLLLAGMGGLLGLVAWILLGPVGIVWLVVLGTVSLGTQSRTSRVRVLRALRARPLPWHAAPALHRWTVELARRAGLRVAPTLHYVPSSTMTALAVGSRDDAAVAVTDGLLRRCPPREVIGVLAHEISHVRSNDLWIMGLSDLLGRFAQSLAWVGLVTLALVPMTARPGEVFVIAIVLGGLPTLVTLLQLALSRSREYDADLSAATLTGDPDGLASALLRLEAQEGRQWERILRPEGRVPDLSLLRTHPRTEDRVRRLRELRRTARSLLRQIDDRGHVDPAALPGATRRRLRASRWPRP